ncbi:MAG: DUF1554 domain-containing protein [Polyangiaceae bacterium]
MKRRSHSLSFTLATALALPFALSPTACELIATVDRSKIDQGGGGGDETGGTGSNSGGMVSSMGGESPGGAGGTTASGGKGSGGKASGGGGAGGEAPGGAGGDSQAGAGGDFPGGAGGAGGDAPTSGGTTQASGGKSSGGTTQSAGGTTSGGATSGGTSSGGASSGGATSGGASSGGTSGGTASGGASGGTASGGTSGGTTASGGASGGSGGTGGVAGKVIYLTSTPKKANFSGITGADAECNANPPVAGTYKALIVDGTTRVACTSANCTTGGASEGVGWVLAPSTTYVRPDGTVIGTTTAAGVFTFPLSAGLGLGGIPYWTGLAADWTTSVDTCTGWTEVAANVFANQGLGDAVTSDALMGTSVSCANLSGAVFACVQQPQ